VTGTSCPRTGPYNETCARQSPASSGAGGCLLATGDAKYADHMERRALQNGFGVGDRHRGPAVLLCQTPLQRREGPTSRRDDPGQRRVWFNLRLLPARNIMAASSHPLSTTLATGSGDNALRPPVQPDPGCPGRALELEVTTDYPWSGAVLPAGPRRGRRTRRGLALRVPAWSASTRVSVGNDPERTPISPGLSQSCAAPWHKGDGDHLASGT